MNKLFQHRKKIFTVFIVILFIVLICRLFYLQIIEGKAMADVSEQNSVRILSVAAPRGLIYDSKGVLLANNEVVFSISITAGDVDDSAALAEKLAGIINDEELTAEAIQETIESHYPSYEPIVLKRYSYDEGLEIINTIEEKRDELPGVTVTEEPMRNYPLGTLAGHILGTVGKISEDELEKNSDSGYLVNDWIGKSGLEKTMETTELGDNTVSLRGEAGVEEVEVTANYRKVDTIYSAEPVAGDSLVLTIDSNIQKTLEDSMVDVVKQIAENQPKCDAAAAVVINVKTGAIIAMASYPFVDPNDFANGLTTEKSKYYWDEDLTPTVNRAIASAYPTGSTFKPITAVALLDSGISTSETVDCNPKNWGKNGRAACTGVHGYVNFYQAMAVSCNSYFQEMGYRVGIDKLNEVGTAFGFGSKTGIELPGEIAGIMPSAEWKASKFTGWENEWHDYDSYYTGMGQGYTSATPLQLAAYVAALANDGVRMKPYLIQEAYDSSGSLLYEAKPTVAEEIDVDPQIFTTVRKGMYMVTQKGGTAYSLAQQLDVSFGAKTGTAQTGLSSDDDKDNHGVFIAFAPYDNPEIAFACVVEYGGHGSSSSGKIFVNVAKAYFGEEVQTQQQTQGQQQ